MNTTSQLQTQYPLSPKKFKKKFISSMLGLIILFAVLIVCALVMEFAISVAGDGSAFVINMVSLGMIVFLGIIVAIKSWYINAYIRNYFYESEPNYLTIRKGVFTSAEIHVPYHKIQDVYVDQDFLDRLMGLYDVHIASATAGSAIEAHIDGVEKEAADGLKNLLLSKIQGGPGNMTSTNADGITSPMQANTNNKVVLNLSKKMSSAEYPITSAWWVGSIAGSIFRSIITALVLVAAITKDDGFESFTITFAVIVLVAMLVWNIIKLGLFVKNYKFEFTPEYLYLKNGIFSMSETHMPYNTIQDVSINQSFINRMFGIYTVVIENAVGGGKAIALIGLSKQSAEEISQTLKKEVLGVHDTNKI